MANYKIKQRVEINGVTRQPDDVIDESEFKPASGRTVALTDETGQTTEGPELSELESLLQTGHVEEVLQ